MNLVKSEVSLKLLQNKNYEKGTMKFMLNKEKKFLSLSEDLLFKEAFAHPDNRDKLIYFLSCFTDFTKEYLESVKINIEYESILSNPKNNSLRGNLLVKFDKYIINIEDYSIFDKNSFDKSMSYSMRVFSNANSETDVSKSVIQINIVDNVTPKDLIENLVEDTMILKDRDNDEIFFNKFQIKYYRLDAVREIEYDKNDLQQRWLRFIGAKTALERKKIAEGDELLMELDNWCEEYINDEQTKKIFADWADYVAENKGIRKGKMEIAQNMLKDNVDVETIKKYTNLTEEEILSI